MREMVRSLSFDAWFSQIQVRNECFKKTILYFGPPGRGRSPINFYWAESCGSEKKVIMSAVKIISCSAKMTISLKTQTASFEPYHFSVAPSCSTREL